MEKKRIQLKLRTRMLLLILSATIFVFVASIGYIGLASRKMAYNKSIENARSIANSSALKIESNLNLNMHIIRTLAEAFSSYRIWPKDNWQELVNQMYYKVYKNNPQIYKLWDSWEKNKIDSGYTLPYGRYVHTYFMDKGKVQHTTVTRSENGDPALYAKIKKENVESIWEPYWDVFTENNEAKKFMTSLSVPINVNNEYIGIVAVDITMDKLQEIISNIHPLESSYAFLVSHNGVIIGHPDSAAIGKTLNQYFPEFNSQHNIGENILNGLSFSFEGIDKQTARNSFFTFVPINIGKTKTPWSIGISMPIDVIMRDANNNFLISVITTIIGLIILSTIIFIFALRITRPITKATEVLKKLEKGEIQNIHDVTIDRNDELGIMADSLNAVRKGLLNTSKFAEEIGKGNLDVEFKLLGSDDLLGKSLIEMQKNLQKARVEEEARKKEDEIQRWTSNGIAKFSELLRQNNDNIENLTFSIISNLVEYVRANQGAIFIYNNQDPSDIFLEQKAAIAYDRRRYGNKKIRIGEDLVGRCAHEKQAIYMTDVPSDYVEITSGLGGATPTTVLIVPAILNNEIFGVIEIASFNKFTDYEISFVEKIGESIASTISGIKVTEKTHKLLLESQEQQEELSSQEEEMRQNLEELKATQEEAARRESEMRGVLAALKSSTLTLEYNLDGTIIDVNEHFANLVGMSREQIIGLAHKDGFDFSTKSKEDYLKFWEDLRHGSQRHEINKIVYNGKDIYLSETYTPVFDQNDNPYKIIKIAYDITEQREALEQLKQRTKELEELNDKTQEQSDELIMLKKQLNECNAKYKILTERLNVIKSSTTKNIIDKENEKDSNIKNTETFVLVELNDNMLLHNLEIDEQHKRIIDLANEFISSYQNNNKRAQILAKLQNLEDYSAWHFKREEDMFKEFNFEKTKEHMFEHGVFMQIIDTLKINISDNIDIKSDWKKLKHWIEKHFASDDKTYLGLLG